MGSSKICCEQRNAEIIDVYRVKQLRRKLSYFIDIDECDVIGKCSQICTNTKGSYKCSCTSDYVLSPNGRNCNPTAGICLSFSETWTTSKVYHY